jgi:hypothetical protein
MSESKFEGGVTGGPKVILRIEGLVLFAVSIALFSDQGQQWWLYPALLLVPDIFMIGYLRNALVTGLGFLISSPIAIAIGAIWFGHIGWDRMFGYGLKYSTSFQHTHLGKIGK